MNIYSLGFFQHLDLLVNCRSPKSLSFFLHLLQQLICIASVFSIFMGLKTWISPVKCSYHMEQYNIVGSNQNTMGWDQHLAFVNTCRLKDKSLDKSLVVLGESNRNGTLYSILVWNPRKLAFRNLSFALICAFDSKYNMEMSSVVAVVKVEPRRINLHPHTFWFFNPCKINCIVLPHMFHPSSDSLSRRRSQR